MSNSDTPLEKTLTDFTPSTTDYRWYVQNDSVMGGLSEGYVRVAGGEVNFTGTTNTNGGGFSSIRTEKVQLNLSDQTGIQLLLKGDGRQYSWQLQTNAEWRGRKISYWADFKTKANEWITVNIPFTQFRPQFRGMQLDGPPIATAEISSMGLYIYDKQNGPFTIKLKNVSVYQ